MRVGARSLTVLRRVHSGFHGVISWRRRRRQPATTAGFSSVSASSMQQPRRRASSSDGRPPPAAVVVWHQRDLRLADNHLYDDLNYGDDGGSGSCESLVAVYCVDDEDFRRRPSVAHDGAWDVCNVGPFAARFLVESLRDLRCQLRKRGADLVVTRGCGPPHVVLTRLINEMAAADPEGVGVRGVEVRWSDDTPGTIEKAERARVSEAMRAWQGSVSLHADTLHI